jgi:hypothetical protein
MADDNTRIAAFTASLLVPGETIRQAGRYVLFPGVRIDPPTSPP